jgi:hypothetical protein
LQKLKYVKIYEFYEKLKCVKNYEFYEKLKCVKIYEFYEKLKCVKKLYIINTLLNNILREFLIYSKNIVYCKN